MTTQQVRKTVPEVEHFTSDDLDQTMVEATKKQEHYLTPDSDESSKVKSDKHLALPKPVPDSDEKNGKPRGRTKKRADQPPHRNLRSNSQVTTTAGETEVEEVFISGRAEPGGEAERQAEAKEICNPIMAQDGKWEMKQVGQALLGAAVTHQTVVRHRQHSGGRVEHLANKFEQQFPPRNAEEIKATKVQPGPASAETTATMATTVSPVTRAASYQFLATEHYRHPTHVSTPASLQAMTMAAPPGGPGTIPKGDVRRSPREQMRLAADIRAVRADQAAQQQGTITQAAAMDPYNNPRQQLRSYTTTQGDTGTETDTRQRKPRYSPNLISEVGHYLAPVIRREVQAVLDDYQPAIQHIARRLEEVERRMSDGGRNQHAGPTSQPVRLAQSPAAVMGHRARACSPRGSTPPPRVASNPGLCGSHHYVAPPVQCPTVSGSRPPSGRPPRRSPSSSPSPSPTRNRRMRRSRTPPFRVPFKITEFTAKAPANKPMEKTMEVSRWVQQIEALVYPSSDRNRIQAAKMACAGEAFGLINSASFAYITDWDEFRQRLFIEFGGTFDANHATAQLWAMRLKALEGPADLCKRIRLFGHYIKRTYPDAIGEVENTIMQVFYQALPNWLSDMVRYQRAISNWQQASDLAQSIWQNETNKPYPDRRPLGEKEDRRSSQGPRRSSELQVQVAVAATPTGVYMAPVAQGTRYSCKARTGMYCNIHDSPWHNPETCKDPNPDCHNCGYYGHSWGSCPSFLARGGGSSDPPAPPSARGRGHRGGGPRGGGQGGRGRGDHNRGRGGGNYSAGPAAPPPGFAAPRQAVLAPAEAQGPNPNLP